MYKILFVCYISLKLKRSFTLCFPRNIKARRPLPKQQAGGPTLGLQTAKPSRRQAEAEQLPRSLRKHEETEEEGHRQGIKTALGDGRLMSFNRVGLA